MIWKMRINVNIHHVVAGGGNVDNYLEYIFCFLKSIFFFSWIEVKKKKKYKFEERKNTKCHLSKWERYPNRDE